MVLSELLAASAPLGIAGPTDTRVRGLAHDSRLVGPGDVFFALPGSKTDANRFVKEAAQRGAVAIVSELRTPPAPVSIPATWVQVQDVHQAMGRMADLFFGRPSEGLAVVGVTGTNGKTTTTYFLEAVIAACGGRPAVIGTVNYRFRGLAQKAVNTTPISLELLRLVKKFKDEGATHVAMEVSSHALSLRRADEIAFDAAVFTNLKRDHLDFHKTQEDYFQAKAHLFELLSKPSSPKKRRVAVLNHDDPCCDALVRTATDVEILTYGFKPGARLRALRPRLDRDGTSFTAVIDGRKRKAALRLVGIHNVANALAAAAAAIGLGLDEEKVIGALGSLESVPGRLSPVEAGQDFRVFVDYAHTDSAIETVLGFLKELPHARLITVFGCGGDRDRTKRGPMGVAACRHSDLAIVTSDNPRSEDPRAIIAEIEEGLKAAGLGNYRVQPDRKEAIAEAVAQARHDDIVLIAGKGHEDYQILRDRTIHFDDAETARQAILACAAPGRGPSTST
ncbi:MAG: UDP-N-acetylmuramoyl-L-alanyl-D-glutamate--2,6-diaminopimelate ligase [Elusimicrobia bacterium]|nr:UDP-N-acetylmuramoyl-L-alanyl-D-glutamate--2,6-diaminopimelate ligase [Elusimicrobiota bacterium]